MDSRAQFVCRRQIHANQPHGRPQLRWTPGGRLCVVVQRDPRPGSWKVISRRTRVSACVIVCNAYIHAYFSQSMGRFGCESSQPRRPGTCSWCLAKRGGGPGNASFVFQGKLKTSLSGKTVASQTMGTIGCDRNQPRGPEGCSWCPAKRCGGLDICGFGFPGKSKTVEHQPSSLCGTFSAFRAAETEPTCAHAFDPVVAVKRAAWMPMHWEPFCEFWGAWSGIWGFACWPDGAGQGQMSSQSGAHAVVCVCRCELCVSSVGAGMRTWGGLCPVFSPGMVCWKLAAQLKSRIGPSSCRVAYRALCFSRIRECIGKLTGGATSANFGSGTTSVASTHSECPAQKEPLGGEQAERHDFAEPGGPGDLMLVTCLLFLAGGFVAWLAWKAKGFIVAGLVAKVLMALEEREAQANQHEPAASEPQVGGGGPTQTEETRGWVQDSLTVGCGGKQALASPVPWGPDELVSFATSMAWQVAQKLSKQEDLAQGVVDRFAEDLLRLSHGPVEPSQAAVAVAWQQEPGDLHWWPMWWCSHPPQWSEAGIEETALTVDEQAACRPTEPSAQAPGVAGLGVQSGFTKPARRRCKKRKARVRFVEPQVSDPDEEQEELSGSAGLLSESDGSGGSSGGDLLDTVAGSIGLAAVVARSLDVQGVCSPCLRQEPGAQPGDQCVAPLVEGSVRSFLSAPEWARVQQAARHLCPGLSASPAVRVDTGLLKEYVDEAFVSGLQEIEGWLDFAGAAEDLDILEEDICGGGTQMTQGARAKLISSLRWRLKDFLEQARQVRTFWASAVSEADGSAQDFMACASALSSAHPHRYVWEVCDPLEADIHAFVHRVAGGGSGIFSHEAAGNFVLVVEAVEECMRKVREMQDTLEKWAEESLALGKPPARRKGPPCADVYWKAQEEGYTAAEAWAMASAEPLPAKVRPSPCRGS